jgi:uncharacterized protein (TIGR02270 family)
LILEDVIEEHAEEAAFLWGQRDAAIRAPDYDIGEIAYVDERLEAHLDGLRIAGDKAWEIIDEVGIDLPGEYFTAMSQAIQLGGDNRVNELLEAAEGDDGATRGVVSALGWVEARRLQGLIKRLLNDKSSYRRQIALAACSVHRVNPGDHLSQALLDPDDGLRARALKAVGELGIVDLYPQVKEHLSSEHEQSRYWAAWTAVLFGGKSAQKVLGQFANSDNPRRRHAMNLLLRVMEHERARLWLRSMAKDPAQLRYALIGTGIMGDPVYLPVLMRQFENEEVARVAGEAFEMITGLNIFVESLEVIPEQPEPTQEEEPEEQTVEELLADEDDDDEDLGEDLGLVVPDPGKMTPWFEQNKDRFEAGQRYLCGQPITPGSCQSILRTGQQRQRIAAALELSLAHTGTPMFECRARGDRQLRRLSRSSKAA